MGFILNWLYTAAAAPSQIVCVRIHANVAAVFINFLQFAASNKRVHAFICFFRCCFWCCCCCLTFCFYYFSVKFARSPFIFICQFGTIGARARIANHWNSLPPLFCFSVFSWVFVAMCALVFYLQPPSKKKQQLAIYSFYTMWYNNLQSHFCRCCWCCCSFSSLCR